MTDAISKGVRKLVRGYKRTRTLKTSRATYRPETKKNAVRQAVAIEYNKHNMGRGTTRRRGRV